MLKRNYRITKNGKILIFQILIFLIGSGYGLVWKVHTCNKKWDNLIFGVKENGLYLSNRSIREDEDLIKSNYINKLLKKTTKIVANNKIYILENSKLIKKYSIKTVVNKSGDENKKISFGEKDKFLEKGIKNPYNVVFDYDEGYIKECIKVIEKDFNRQCENASVHSINSGNIEISPDIKGCKVNASKLEEKIKKTISYENRKNNTVKVPIIESKAAITADKISCINAKISSFTTNFSSSSCERINNIELSTKLINGKLLMPNEVFSFNDCVGERTKDRGFMMAPIIVGDKVDCGIGGGICQVSSTLYNVVLRAGLKPIKITHHTVPSSYVELGLDATVNWDDIDFKFKNTLNYPIYIEAYTHDKNLYINAYSNLSLLNEKYVILSNVYETIYPVTKTIENPNLPKGQSLSLQQAHNGYKVKVIRNKYKNEKLIASEIISDEEYSPIPGIIEVGQK